MRQVRKQKRCRSRPGLQRKPGLRGRRLQRVDIKRQRCRGNLRVHFHFKCVDTSAVRPLSHLRPFLPPSLQNTMQSRVMKRFPSSYSPPPPRATRGESTRAGYLEGARMFPALIRIRGRECLALLPLRLLI